MLDVWGLRVIIGHKRGGALTELIFFEGGGDVFKNFSGTFQLFCSARLGSARLSDDLIKSGRYSLPSREHLAPFMRLSSSPSLKLKVNNPIERERDKG